MRTCSKCERTYPEEADFCPRDGSPLVSAQSSTEANLAAGLARSYRIIRRLGGGGMGAVFLAEQIALGNRPVALKILLRKLLDNPEFLQRFHNEAASTARIRHPNVITVHELGQSDDGSPYIAMEYLEGETLGQALQRRGALPVAEVIEIVRQIARGLNAAHKLDIIHRDLKPDNIFLAKTEDASEGTVLPGVMVKIMDFGIARLRESSLTLTGTVLGTPAYMSFEQASGMRSERLDARSDIYSLGVVVYEMLTGRVPFCSDTPLGYVQKHVRDEPPPFKAVAPSLHISPEIERVVMKALRKPREERQSSVLEFARELAVAAQLGKLVETSEAPTILHPQAAAPAPSPVAQNERQVITPAPVVATPVPKSEPPVSYPQPRFTEAPTDATGRKKSLLKVIMLVLVLVLTAGAGLYFWKSKNSQAVPQSVSTWTDPATGLMWARQDNGSDVNWNQASNYCRNLSLGDHSDWRLPTIDELAGIYDPTQNVNGYRIKGGIRLAACCPWSSTDRAAGEAWSFAFHNGERYYFHLDRSNVPRALCVRHSGDQPVPNAPQPTTHPAADSTPAKIQAKVNPKDGLTYVWIAPGQFMMGCSPGDGDCMDNEKPSHRVTISKGFWIGQTLVTQAAYKRVAGSNPSYFHGDRLPVERVSWDEARSYCEAVGMRLPTEGEWEFAARAGSTSARYGKLNAVAWHYGNSGKETHPVGQKQPNTWELYDMLGNVWEWVQDLFDENYYGQSPGTDPPGPSSGKHRVVRGGSWRNVAISVRVSRRLGTVPSFRLADGGFRCVQEPAK